uniref:Uncharacterized protein n=1 Tax=Romanomermis culicivorax TaxID=13658 RepID=A0A915JXH8_ROMCU
MAPPLLNVTPPQFIKLTGKEMTELIEMQNFVAPVIKNILSFFRQGFINAFYMYMLYSPTLNFVNNKKLVSIVRRQKRDKRR